MEEVPKFLYLQQPKNRNYEVRRVIDKELRPYLDNKKELIKSLGTKNYREAIKRYTAAFNEIQSKIEKAEKDYEHAKKIEKTADVLLTLKDSEITGLVEQWFHKMDKRTEADIYRSLRNQDEDCDESFDDVVTECRYEIDIVKGQSTNIRYAPDDIRYGPNYGYYNEDIERMVLSPAGFSRNFTPDTYKKINIQMVEAMVTHQQRNIKRLKGNHIEVTPYKPLKIIENPSNNGQSNKTLKDIFDEYWNEKKQQKNIKAGTLKNDEGKFRFLADYFGEKPITSITRQDVVKMMADIQKLPVKSGNMKAKFAGKSYQEIIAITEHDNTIPKKSLATANKYVTKLKTLYMHAQRSGYIDNIAFLDKLVEKPKSSRKQGRKNFTVVELNTIFSAPFYKEDRQINDRDAKFWAALISLFHGMRLEECCQLFVSDIKCSNGVFHFVLEEDEEGIKSFKNSASERYIPIHSELLKMGFLNKVNDAKRKNHQRLFQELEPSREGRFSAQVSKWFSNFRKSINVGIKENANDSVFHSFRHTFRSQATKCKMNKEYIYAIGGWTDGNVASNYLHIDEDHLLKLNEEIEKLNYEGLNLSHLYIENPATELI